MTKAPIRNAGSSKAGPSYFYIYFVCLLAGVVAVAGIMMAINERPPSPGPRFVVGQQLDVIYSCVATVGCYGEALVIREVSPDGWLLVANRTEEWWMPISSIVSYRKHVDPPAPVRIIHNNAQPSQTVSFR